MATTTSVYVDPNTGGVQAGLMQFRNKIINGNFDVWQRGVTFNAVVSSAYAADRWLITYDGSGSTRSMSREAFTTGQNDVPNNPKFWLRVSTTVAGTGGGYVSLLQKIEGVQSFSSKTVTVSFWAKSTPMSVRLVFQQVFGSGGSPSAIVQFLTDYISLSTVWQKYTFVVNIPSILGKTLGTNNDDYLLLSFGLPANTTFTFDLAQVQVEEGQKSTPFEVRPYPVELQLCQRYYVKYECTLNGGTSRLVTGMMNSASEAIFSMNTPTSMMKTPTIRNNNLTIATATGQSSIVGNLNAANSFANTVTFSCTVSPATTALTCCQIRFVSINAYVEFEGEL